MKAGFSGSEFLFMSPGNCKKYFRQKIMLFIEVVNIKLHGFQIRVNFRRVVLKMIQNKEIKGANCKEKIINIKNEDILTKLVNIHLPL